VASQATISPDSRYGVAARDEIVGEQRPAAQLSSHLLIVLLQNGLVEIHPAVAAILQEIIVSYLRKSGGGRS
jgi:hypothetical protein